jgi:MFS family permease
MTTFPKRCLSTIDKVSAQIKQAGFVEAVFRQTRPTEPFMSPLLFALFLATFAIGTTEFAIVGLLPDIAASLDVSISRAGLLVSGYALGVAIGGPVIVALTSSQPRKRTLLQLCAIFVVGHALAALAPDYGWLMGARVLAAVSHASFLGIAAIVAAGSVPPERSARAVSFVWLGFSAASLVGVPSGLRSAMRLAGAPPSGCSRSSASLPGRPFSSGCPRLRAAGLRVSERKSSPCGVRKSCWLWR